MTVRHTRSFFWLICATFPACGLVDMASGNSPGAIAARNQQNLDRLRIGMSYAEAQAVMVPSEGGIGVRSRKLKSPFRVERAVTPDSKSIVVAYYFTQDNDDARVTEDELTPVVFVDDKLVGYGRAALAAAQGR